MEHDLEEGEVVDSDNEEGESKVSGSGIESFAVYDSYLLFVSFNSDEVKSMTTCILQFLRVCKM